MVSSLKTCRFAWTQAVVVRNTLRTQHTARDKVCGGGGLWCLKMSTQTFLMRVQPRPIGFAPTFTFTPRGQGCPPSAQVEGLCAGLWRNAPPCTLFSSWFCPGLPSSAQVAKGWTKNRVCAAALAPAGCRGSSATILDAQGSLSPGKGDVREQPNLGASGGVRRLHG